MTGPREWRHASVCASVERIDRRWFATGRPCTCGLSAVRDAPRKHRPHPLVFTYDKRKAHYGRLDQNVSFVQVTGGGNCTVANARDAMGIDWMTKNELNEAVPPAYTEWVGTQLLAHLQAEVPA